MSTIGSGVGPIGSAEATPVADTSATEATSTLSSGLSSFAELAQIAGGTGQIGNNERGDHVRAVQQALVDLLGAGTVGSTGADGWWGANSAAGLKGFQEQNGLPATGFVDQDTLLALDTSLTEAAGKAMSRTLNEAAADGLLGAAELQQAEADISAKYGPEVAKDVLLESFGAHAGNLDMAAVKFLQGKMGSMEGHIGRYQDILDENLAGAQILDVNQDGNIDKGDLVFSEGADGKVNIEALGAARTDELKIGRAMVDACKDVAGAKFDFELIKNHRANPEFFTVESGGVFTLKEGQKPSEALLDMFENSDEYGFECATAMVVVYYKATLDLIGPEDFDRVMAGMTLGPWKYDSDLRSAKELSSVGSGGRTDMPEDAPAERPGEYRYIRNWDVSDEGKAAGWQGENVIYLGDGEYYGHPFGVATGESIVAYLNGHRNEGSTRSASQQDIQGFLTSKVLEWDENPNE